MTDVDEAHKKRKLKVDMASLEIAFDDTSGQTSYYLDLETGEVAGITDEVRRELEEIYEELPEEEGELGASLEALLRQRDLPEWMKDALLEADRVETGYGERFVSVPKADSGEGYSDMEEFITIVKDRRLRDLLEVAISGRGAFRRFKDVLARYPSEEERWFRFKDDRLRQRILDWLGEEGIEPI